MVCRRKKTGIVCAARGEKTNIPSAKLLWNEFSCGIEKVLNSCRENKTHREEKCMKTYRPLLANVLAQTIFGLGYFFIKMGMAVVNQDTVKFLSFRFTLGFLAMTVVLLLGIQKVDYKKGFVGLIILCGLFNPSISQILETTSTSYAPTSQIAMYNSMLPIVMLIFSALINKEYPTRRQLMFVLVCVAAV